MTYHSAMICHSGHTTPAAFYMANNINKNSINKKAEKFLPAMDGYSSRKEWEDVCWQKILKSEKLLQLFSTANERHNMVMRCVVLDKLTEGKSYRQIANELFLSPQTINSIKRAINEKTYRSYLQRSKTERKKKKYSVSPVPDKEYRGRPKRTKYGTIYLPF